MCAVYGLYIALLEMYLLHSRIGQVGRNSLENTLLKYSAKDHFFKAAICHFCIGAEDAKVRRGGGKGEVEREGGSREGRAYPCVCA